MDLGFDGASMGEIARSAGVSKGTLYVYFADKNRLFEAIVEEESLEQGKTAFNFDPARDVETTLREFGRAYIQLLCRPGGGSAIRTVMAIAERMPEVGRRFYENVLARTINRLAAYLEARCTARRPRDRRLPARGLAIHADVPGVAVSAVHLPGRARALARAHRDSRRQRDADVSGGVSGEVSETVTASATEAVSLRAKAKEDKRTGWLSTNSCRTFPALGAHPQQIELQCTQLSSSRAPGNSCMKGAHFVDNRCGGHVRCSAAGRMPNFRMLRVSKLPPTTCGHEPQYA